MSKSSASNAVTSVMKKEFNIPGETKNGPFYNIIIKA